MAINIEGMRRGEKDVQRDAAIASGDGNLKISSRPFTFIVRFRIIHHIYCSVSELVEQHMVSIALTV
jgi:hypothetical protein